MKVEIYTKASCPLCDDAKQVLERVRSRLPFELFEVDIEKDPKLFARYRYDIPVVMVEGRKAFKHRLNERDVEKRLMKESGTHLADSSRRGE